MRSSLEEETLTAISGGMMRSTKRKLTELNAKFATLDKIEINNEEEEIKSEHKQIEGMAVTCLAPKKNKRENLKLLTHAPSSSDYDDTRVKSKTPHPVFSGVQEGLFSYPPKETNPYSSIANFHLYGLTYDVSMRECNRPNQQDRFVCLPKLKEDHSESFFAVYDGHRTAMVSGLLSEVLHKYIMNHEAYDSNFPKAVREGFVKLDNEIIEYQKLYEIDGGSTALCAFVKNEICYLINLGDSIACIVTPNEFLQLTSEHKPNNKTERERLESMGALITENKKNVMRVSGELALSRSFGDRSYKEYITAEPEINQYDLKKLQCEWAILLLATDGFWNCLDKDSCNHLIKKWYSDAKDPTIESLSEFLTREACERNSNKKKDNMTLIVVDLKLLYGKIKSAGKFFKFE